MALEYKGFDRVFCLSVNGTTVKLTDPDPQRTPEQVMALYANQYPQLTTSTVGEPAIEGGKAVYEFKTTHGKKG